MKKLVVAPLMALMLWLSAAGAWAEGERNKCGCYRDGAGTCYCDKKARCGCPGECEPKGCEEARNKQIQKEIEAETRKAEESGRRHTTAGGGAKSAGEASGKSEDPAGEAKESREVAKRPGKKLTAAQSKQLVKLLDLYFAANPDARARNVEEVRNELSQAR